MQVMAGMVALVAVMVGVMRGWRWWGDGWDGSFSGCDGGGHVRIGVW